MSDNNPLPLLEEINKWGPSAVISFLESRKELFLDNDDIKAIRTSKITSSDFLNYSTEDFRECGLQVGLAKRITKLSEELRPKICNVTFKYQVKENKTVECNRRDHIVSIIYYLLTELTLKLLQEHAQKEFKFLATTHDEIVIKYNKSILSNDITVRSIFKTKENIKLIVTLDKKYFSSYKNLREVLQKHGIDNDEVHSIPVFFPNCENEKNYTEVFEDCVKEIKARLSAIGNVGNQNEAQRSHFITSILVSAVNSVPNTIFCSQFKIIGDVSVGRVDYTIKKIYPQLVGSGFEEIVCITKAKQIDIKVCIAQSLMQLEGSLDSNKNKKCKLD
ncbi:11801_t:CDS:2 [Dentiscutata heterogama]|uniref:11801_t:CDS:1 n=1 Tax=Dentiscutata heterogama TaxID=1316150 RepID=A0ACA9MG33_9GLOM|nr:11801_t:CDS:2 [Dentiscutata heterogama]